MQSKTLIILILALIVIIGGYMAYRNFSRGECTTNADGTTVCCKYFTSPDGREMKNCCFDFGDGQDMCVDYVR